MSTVIMCDRCGELYYQSKKCIDVRITSEAEYLDLTRDFCKSCFNGLQDYIKRQPVTVKDKE